MILKCQACGTDNPVDAYDPASPPFCDHCFGILRGPQEHALQPPQATAPAVESPSPAAATAPPILPPPPQATFAEPPPRPELLPPSVPAAAASPAEPPEVAAAAANDRNLFGPPGPDGKPGCVLLGPLGQDATGAVYKAYDRVKGQPFAVRFMAGQAGEKESALLDERMQDLVRLPHPNILQVQGTGRRQSRLYIATDLVDAEPLGKSKIRDIPRLCAIFKDASEAIAYAHSAEIYHGDVNPENILLSRTEDRVYVKDFQLANLLETLARQASSKDTTELHNPAFLPPEQAKQSSRTPSAAGDVYGLGATLYTALAGRPPFEGATSAKILARIQMEEPPALEKLRPDVSEALAAVVRHAMAKETALRYPTAKEMAEALARVMKGAELAAQAQKFDPEAVVMKPSTRRAAAPAVPAPKLDPEGVVTKPSTRRAVAPAAPPPLSHPAPKPAPSGKKFGWTLFAAAAVLLMAGGGFFAFRSLLAPTAARPTSAPPAGKPETPGVTPIPEQPGQVELDLRPTPSQVLIDGKRIDAAQKALSLRRGRHRILVRFGDAYHVDREVDVSPGGTEKLEVRAHGPIAAKHEERGQWADAERLYREALALAAPADRGEIEDQIARVVKKRLEEESGLRVESVPAGAAVAIDGTPSGLAPTLLGKLKAGVHTIELRLDGYHPESRRVEYEPGQTPPIRVELRPQTGTVRVLGLRPKDRVKLAGRTVEAGEGGIVELDSVKIGEFEVVVERAGHNDARAKGRVEADKTTEVAGLVFDPSPGSLVVESTPAGAEVQVDGRAVGKTPLLLSELPPGAKKLLLVHPERSDWEGVVQVKSGEKAEVKTLLPAMAKLTVTAHPEGARLTGSLTGVTHAEVPLKAGEHRVRVSHPDAGSVERVFRLAAGEDVADIVDLWQLRGEELEKAGKLEEAARAYSMARAQTRDRMLPRLAAVWTAQAEEFLKAQDWTKARQAAGQAQKAWPGQTRPKEIINAAAYEEGVAQADESAARGDWVKTKTAAERALAARPGDGRALELSRTAVYRESMARGVALQKEARWGEARHAYDQALAARPGDAEAAGAIERLKSLGWAESRFLPGSALAVAISPAGKTLAVGRMDKKIELWNLETGKLDRTLAGHAGPVSCVAFSPDGNRLASGAADGKAKVWDVASGAETDTLTGHEAQIWAIAFSRDGTRLASASDDRTVRLWEAATGKELRVLSGHAGSVSSVAFTPDGRHLASSGADKTIKLWDAERGQEERAFVGHDGAVSQVVFSPDGKRLASAGGDRTVRLWDLESGRELRTLAGHTSHVSQAVFTPDGRLLVSVGGDKLIRLWDAEKGLELRTLSGHTREVWSVAVAADGTRMATAGSDGVRLWVLGR
jgi:WD40 repeat protein